MSESTDLTISECLRDPLIAVLMHADGVKLEEFRQLLETVARNRESKLDNIFNAGAKERSTQTPASSHRTGYAVSLIGTAGA